MPSAEQLRIQKLEMEIAVHEERWKVQHADNAKMTVAIASLSATIANLDKTLTEAISKLDKKLGLIGMKVSIFIGIMLFLAEVASKWIAK